MMSRVLIPLTYSKGSLFFSKPILSALEFIKKQTELPINTTQNADRALFGAPIVHLS